MKILLLPKFKKRKRSCFEESSLPRKCLWEVGRCFWGRNSTFRQETRLDGTVLCETFSGWEINVLRLLWTENTTLEHQNRVVCTSRLWKQSKTAPVAKSWVGNSVFDSKRRYSGYQKHMSLKRLIMYKIAYLCTKLKRWTLKKGHRSSIFPI